MGYINYGMSTQWSTYAAVNATHSDGMRTTALYTTVERSPRYTAKRKNGRYKRMCRVCYHLIRDQVNIFKNLLLKKNRKYNPKPNK